MNPLRAKSADKTGKPGELLTSHLLHTLEALFNIRDRVGDIPGMPPDFWTLAALAALLHDGGKLPDGFQRMIGNTADPPVVWGERHEVLSLGIVDLLTQGLTTEQRLLVATLVAAHHRPFTQGSHQQGQRAAKPPLITLYGHDQPGDFADRFTPADQARLTELMMWLHTTGHRFGLPLDSCILDTRPRDLTDAAHRTFGEVMNRWEFPLRPRDPAGTTAVLMLGAVTMADHLSSAHAALHTRHPLTRDYPNRLARRLADRGHTLRPQQQQAAATTGHLLLRSWTGSGKTEAVLLWARTQITQLADRTGGNPRLFYLLPYLASINAMTERLTEDLQATGGIGVAHSKAASYHLARSLADGCPSAPAEPAEPADLVDAAEKAHSRAEATRNFRELVRVATPYQLLRGVLAGAVHSPILTDSANSVFVLDELHAYDTRRLGMILAIMRFWHDLGGRIAVLSATLPNALAELVTHTLNEQVTLVEPPPATPTPLRHHLHTRPSHLTDDTSLAEIRQRITAGQSVLVVANNIRDAITIYQELRPFCIDLHGEESAHLLHSRYKRMDRTRIETAIRERFASGKPRRPGLLVGTQALEVSLDLDLDACHTSAADLEALIQRFGRVNRLTNLPPAPVVVHQPTYAPRRHGGTELWADGVYQAAPTQRGWDILTRHDGQTIDETLITAWLDEIYAGPWGQDWRQETENHRRLFTEAFLNFQQPFDDRTHLARAFDEQFDGIEAILTSDHDKYEDALKQGTSKKAGQLFADQYLLPLPAWATGLGSYDKKLGVRVIDANYDSALGLLNINKDPTRIYQAGEIL